MPVHYSEAFLAKMAQREKNIRLQALEVLDRRRAVEDARNIQEKRRNARKATGKLKGWRQQYAIQKDPEKLLRCPDRSFPVRLYSKMDNDVWKLPELRSWFQMHAVEPKLDTPDPQRRGYLVTASASPTYQNHLTLRTPPTTAPVSLGRRMDTPCCHDFEGCLKQQKHNAELKLAERHYYPPQAPGRVSGFRQAPWLDRPDG